MRRDLAHAQPRHQPANTATRRSPRVRRSPRTPFASLWLLVAGSWLTVTLTLALAGGCDTAGRDIADLLETPPSPTEAAAWMFGPDPEQRRRGITLIANAPFGDNPPYVEVYRQALTDGDPMVRAAAAHAVGLNGVPDDAPALARLLGDEIAIVRWNAAKGLQRLHMPTSDVLNPLRSAMLNDEDPAVRRAAAIALGQYGEASVVEALIGALGDRSLSVNLAARRSLRYLTGEDFGVDGQAWLNWWRSAEAPFANQRMFMYPVFTRNLTWIERLIPFFRPRFEFPGPPIGLDVPDPTAVEPETAPTPGADDGAGADAGAAG